MAVIMMMPGVIVTARKIVGMNVPRAAAMLARPLVRMMRRDHVKRGVSEDKK